MTNFKFNKPLITYAFCIHKTKIETNDDARQLISPSSAILFTKFSNSQSILGGR